MILVVILLLFGCFCLFSSFTPSLVVVKAMGKKKKKKKKKKEGRLRKEIKPNSLHPTYKSHWSHIFSFSLSFLCVTFFVVVILFWHEER